MLTEIAVLFFFKMLTLCKSYIIIYENVLIGEEKTKEKTEVEKFSKLRHFINYDGTKVELFGRKETKPEHD